MSHFKALGTLMLAQVAAIAQPTPPLTINEAVQLALQNYPAVRASLENVSSATAAINLARTAYLPRADFLGQINRATRNNVFGLLLPQPVIPAISGPVLGSNSMTGVWGSAAGVLVSWEPFDFGLRRANVEAAESTRRRAEAGVDVTRLQVATAAADSFLSLLAAEQTVTAARASVDRARVLDQVVGALAQAGLRPGADAARARAELALAETQLIQVEQAVDVARATLGQFLNLPSNNVSVQPGPLLALPAQPASERGALSTHPAAVEQKTAIDEVRAAERALARSWVPRFNVEASSYARGTGARIDGTTAGSFGGVGPNIRNWALGLNILFPAFDLASIRARQQIEAHRELSATAQYNRILDDLRSQYEKAQAQLTGARRVAQNTPIQRDAARAAEEQATARYKSGLGNIVEVAEAQRLLTQAEIDDGLARLGVWRGLLAVAAAQGDLQPFLQMAGR